MLGRSRRRPAGSEHPTPRSPRSIVPPVAPAPSSAGSAIVLTSTVIDPARFRATPRKDSGDTLSRFSPARRPLRSARARFANCRRAPSAAARGRRLAPLLRHQRVPHPPPARRAYRRRRLPDLRLPAPHLLTVARSTGSRTWPPRGGGAGGHHTARAAPPPRFVDGAWITRPRPAKLVDRTPCGPGHRRPSSGQPEGAVMNGPRAAARRSDSSQGESDPPQRRVGPSAREAKRSDGRTGAARCRACSQEREVLRKECRSLPQGWRVPRKGGVATGSSVLSGAFAPGARRGAEASRM